MNHAYVLQHTIEHLDGEDSKLIGVYSSKAAAEAAIARLREKPGFQLPHGEFQIDVYEVDQDNWTQGFGFGTE